MNNTDRKRLKRIYDCLRIPGCNLHPGGGQGPGIEGCIGYAYDASYAIPKIQDLLYMIGNGETWEGEFEEEITELESWHEMRKSEDWQTPGKTDRHGG